MTTRRRNGHDSAGHLQLQKNLLAAEQKPELRTRWPPIFNDMPRPEQRLAGSNRRGQQQQLLQCPDFFFGVDHPNTAWLVNLLRDTCEARMQKSLLSLRTRTLFESDRYYQLVDRPSHYLGQQARLWPSLFKQHAMLYLNAFGVALYLRTATGCQLLASGSSASRLADANSRQFASFVHDRDSDLLQFHCDLMCLKLEHFDGLQYLAKAGWRPTEINIFTYRRKYYQYSVPFTDWLDVLRFLLEQRPQLNVAGLVEKLYAMQYVSSSSEHSMSLLKEVGKVMLEPFDLKELKPEHRIKGVPVGLYVGRRLLRDKSSLQASETYAGVFSGTVVHPVVPNVVSFARRLLAYQYYCDGQKLRSLPQIIRAVGAFRKHGFFVAGQAVRGSEETDITGLHRVYLDPLLFQVQYFLNLGSGGKLLRQKTWNCDKFSDEEVSWVYRFDAINCVSLLTGLLQNCLLRNLSHSIVDSICDLIVHLLYDSELLEAFLRYSYYDTYFGLTSVVNCVPNLSSNTVMRLLRKAPITLLSCFDLNALQRAFTAAYWRVDSFTKKPKDLEEMADFLVNKKRRVSMLVDGPTTSESASSTSSAGLSGNVIQFQRSYNLMEEMDEKTETGGQLKMDTTKKQRDEMQHVREYRQLEVDARYSSVYPQYHSELNKPKVEWLESLTYSECLQRARSSHIFVG